MKSLLVLLLTCLMLVNDATAQTPSKTKPTAASEIRKLVPFAAGMKLGDIDKLATAVSSPKPSDVKSKTLTLMLLSLKVKADDEKAREEFHFLRDRLVKPSELAKEINRSVRGIGRFRFALGPVTMIHTDRITNFTCSVDGDTATEKVSFKAPKLCQGKVNYVARRKSGKWRLEEFTMPANKIHIVLADKGMWVQK
jgi:hypothetical protein